MFVFLHIDVCCSGPMKPRIERTEHKWVFISI